MTPLLSKIKNQLNKTLARGYKTEKYYTRTSYSISWTWYSCSALWTNMLVAPNMHHIQSVLDWWTIFATKHVCSKQIKSDQIRNYVWCACNCQEEGHDKSQNVWVPQGRFELNCLGVLKWSLLVYFLAWMIQPTPSPPTVTQWQKLASPGMDTKKVWNQGKDANTQEDYPITERWWKTKPRRLPYICRIYH